MKSFIVLSAVIAVCLAAPQPGKRSVGHEFVVPVSSVAVAPQLYEASLVRSPVLVSSPVYSQVSAVSPVVYSGAPAVSHQSRVDIKSSPSYVVPVANPVAAVATPVVTPVATNVLSDGVVVEAKALNPTTTYVGGSAVSQESRVDVKSQPAVVTEQVVSPAIIGTQVYNTGYLSPVVRNSPVFSHQVLAPATYGTHAYVPSVYTAW
ncbi:unnamed protein product [Leptidea sinapis]|uniref:Uncharacterized protein n=1 Tax=Leptidea sinapis TaxID=189913 RepID=A0A5E4R6I7_9NEOP|nr:unnamed protein product [Leptidea sinapis]